MHQTTADGPQTRGRVLHRARCYDLFTRKMSLGRERLIRLASPAPGESVLDVGCGPGTLAIALAPRVAPGRAHGIDASPEMIEVAKTKAAKAGLDVDLQVGLIEAIPFGDDSFDLVTSSLMFHHLPDDLKESGLREIRRVLKPGGRCLVLDFAEESHSRLGHLLSVAGHVRGDNVVEKLGTLMRAAGFEHVEAAGTGRSRLAFIRGR